VKGQYFSFDAVVATVIMVVAITSLAAYWFGVQSVVESRNNPMYADSLRIAESLLSPGSPSNWTLYASGADFDLDAVRQIGIGADFGNQLDSAKIKELRDLSSAPANYTAVGRIMRATGDYYIKVEQTDNLAGDKYYIGIAPPLNATEVVIANRGAVLKDKPVRLQVYLWRK
jgi:hypothetical protein